VAKKERKKERNMLD